MKRRPLRLSGEALRVAIADYDTVMRRGSLEILRTELAAAHLERVQNTGSKSMGSKLYVSDLTHGLASIIQCDPAELVAPAERYLWGDDQVTVGLRTLHAYAQRLRATPDRRRA